MMPRLLAALVALLVLAPAAAAAPGAACTDDYQCDQDETCAGIAGTTARACVAIDDFFFPIPSPQADETAACECMCLSDRVQILTGRGGYRVLAHVPLWYPVGRSDNRYASFFVPAFQNYSCERLNGYRCYGYADDLAALHRDGAMVAGGVTAQCWMLVERHENLGQWWNRLPHAPR